MAAPAPSHRVVRLRTEHHRSDFECGNDSLDRYIRQVASQDQRRDLTRVYVMVEEGTEQVVGYYTLSSSSVELAGLPTSVAKRLPRYPSIPSVLLGRLAVARNWQGRGLGSALLGDAFRRILVWQSEIAAWAVLVEATDEAAVGFYERLGFMRFEDDPLRLFLPIATLRRAME